MKLRTVDKVTAFITRWQNEKPELLVLHHPLAGRQLPAGTVEINEPLEKALLREVAEETGLVDIEIITYLGSGDSFLTGNDHVILVTTKLFSSPSYDASSAGYILERGLPVRVTNKIGKFSAVLCDPLDPYEQSPTRQQNVSGYVRSSVLGKHIRRHLFQLKPTTWTPEKWQKQVDGHLMEFCWRSLDPQPILHPDHSDWLDSIYEMLITVDSLGESKIGYCE
ncbi:MAG TPA: NUDIX domain-containing protein [Patescibacteria group bacterium]|jgi:8-oxo-dGTP pyrophosphatase MutT (NUDIX family)|nr:NUDIX domain-containing protein [Patescibacteria group bacterium]